MIRVLVADDHVVVRKGLKRLLEMMGDVVVSGEAVDGLDTIEKLRGGGFDLALVDFTMPTLGGVNMVVRIRSEHPDLPILVLSMHNEVQVARSVLQAGANGFVTKGSAQGILAEAVRKTAAGGRFVDPAIAEQLMFPPPASDKTVPHDRLSARELLILKLFSNGRSINEIAEELFISSKTVSTHKARLMQKLNIQSNAELVRYALDQGLVE